MNEIRANIIRFIVTRLRPLPNFVVHKNRHVMAILSISSAVNRLQSASAMYLSVSVTNEVG